LLAGGVAGYPLFFLGTRRDDEEDMAKSIRAGGPRATDSKTTRVQVKNPITERWVKLNTKTGRIVDTKKSPGPYKNIPRK
jgi:hypothetical protein